MRIVVDACELPSETGRCRAYIPSWYYDTKEGRCKTFIYGGCGGNENRFPTEAACQQKCGKDLCKLPSEVGPCDGFNPSWYYNYDEKKCKQFIYGGCDGNANRFETQTECQQRCGEEPVCSNGQLPIPERTCGGLLPGNECPSGYTCVGDLVPVDGPGVCCPTDPEPVCSQGKPLPGRTCGGRRLGNQCPRGYQCEGEQLAFDGPGVCCPTDTGPSDLVCPPLPPDTFGICVELCPIEGCPTGQLCCSNGCGNVCKVGVPREAPTTHPLCPRLNPLVNLQCFRFEECPQRGCPGRQQCCPSYCGTTCRALRPPCGTQPPLRDSFGRQLFCGRGPNRVDCPSNHYCAIDPTDRYAVCCPYL